MILCAGLGTRLRPLTDELPKPLVPVGDRPAVAHVADAIRGALPGVRVVVNAHHRAEELARWAEPEGISVSAERELLGTAGGLAAAARHLGPADVLVWNGDISSALDPSRLLGAHRAEGAEATLAVAPRAAGEGNVGLDEAGRVVRLRGERFGAEVRGGDFLGVHVLGAELRARLPPVGCLVGDLYLPALRSRSATLRAFVTDAPFLDVGTLAAYAEANAGWLRARGLASFRHATAEIAPYASLDGSVVGAGAKVMATAVRCVVWPGAVVESPVADAVVTPRGVVPVPRSAHSV